VPIYSSEDACTDALRAFTLREYREDGSDHQNRLRVRGVFDFVTAVHGRRTSRGGSVFRVIAAYDSRLVKRMKHEARDRE
jgi:hypothetical protein